MTSQWYSKWLLWWEKQNHLNFSYDVECRAESNGQHQFIYFYKTTEVLQFQKPIVSESLMEIIQVISITLLFLISTLNSYIITLNYTFLTLRSARYLKLSHPFHKFWNKPCPHSNYLVMPKGNSREIPLLLVCHVSW